MALSVPAVLTYGVLVIFICWVGNMCAYAVVICVERILEKALSAKRSPDTDAPPLSSVRCRE